MPTLTDDQRRTIATNWFNAVNRGDAQALGTVLDANVVDHSGLNDGHGGGSDGHQQLVAQLLSALPNWQSKIDDIKVNGDTVTIWHSGSGVYPPAFAPLMGKAPTDDEMARAKFEIVSTVRIDDNGKIVEHWANQGPFGRKSTPGALSDDDRKRIAQRWYDALNSGDFAILDEVLSPNVVDHSGLNIGHGGGADGHKQLLTQLRSAFPDWSSRIDDLSVAGDVVTISHAGSGTYPQAFAPLMGRPPTDAEMKRIEFDIVSKVRIDNSGKIVEHWSDQTPFGKTGQNGTPAQSPPGSGPYGGTAYPPATGAGGTGSLEDNKLFLRNYVANVIDRQDPSLAQQYFAPNFFNHDRAPTELPGLPGVTAFLQSIFSAFTGFHTTIEEQMAEGDLVVGRWHQTFKNTGDYLAFKATNKDVHVEGITITRIRGGRIVEEWEARDALSLLVQMGAVPPLPPLEGGGSSGGTTGGGSDTLKSVAESFFYDAWDRGNVDLVDQLFSADYVNHNPLAGQQAGRAGIKQLISRFHEAFPDFSVSVDLMLAERDRVVTRYTFRGTQQGTFVGVQPTGKPVEITGITILGISNGLISESWGYWEQISMLAQLGVIQLPTGTGGGPPSGYGGPPGQSPPGQQQPPQQW